MEKKEANTYFEGMPMNISKRIDGLENNKLGDVRIALGCLIDRYFTPIAQ